MKIQYFDYLKKVNLYVFMKIKDNKTLLDFLTIGYSQSKKYKNKRRIYLILNLFFIIIINFNINYFNKMKNKLIDKLNFIIF